MLRTYYPQNGSKKTAELLCRSQYAVTLKANRLGIKRPHYSFIADYFNVIDSADKAYWLGFIIADGYVCYNSDKRSYYLGIELSAKDTDHLVKFRQSIDADNKIVYRTRILENGANCQMASIRIYSKQMVEDLAQYGVVPSKTYCLEKVIVPDEYLWDYIRGYFDGDGSFSVRSIQTSSGRVIDYGHLSFIGHSKDFMDNVKDLLITEGIDSNIYYDNGNWTIHIRKAECVRRFYDLIYNAQDSIKLERKYNKFYSFYAA